MEETAREFINSFHNLPGATTSEKKHSLYKLFHSHPEILSNSELQDLITMELTPQSHCEKIFLVEYLIHCRRIAELIKEFQSGNEIITSKLSKHNWFFEAAFQQITPDFVNQILPQLPYTTRLRILKKLVLVVDQRQNDKIFELLLARYGIFIATHLLVGCSAEKITQVLLTYNILLSASQIKLLYGKGAGLVEVYFDERIKHEGNKNFLKNNTIFRFVAMKSIEDFCRFLEKYDFETRLGKHTSEKFIEAKRDLFVSNPERYVKILNAAVVAKKLRGEDFLQVYRKVFPKSVEAHPAGQACRLLKHFPKKRQFALLQATFNQTFREKLEESPSLIDDKILKMAPNNQLREELAVLKWGEDSDEALVYLTTEKATAKIKQKFNFARYPYERSNLIRLMATTCLVNNDYAALLAVSEYITQRLKNDYMVVQQNFLLALLHTDYGKLTERHWKYIREIFARPDFQTICDHHLKPFFYHSVEFLLRNLQVQAIREEILRFFKLKSLDLADWQHLKALQPATVKHFLAEFTSVLPEIKQDFAEVDCTLVLLIKRHNIRSENAKIDIAEFPRLFQSVSRRVSSEKLTRPDETLSETVEYLICRSQREETESLTEIYWSNVNLIQDFGIQWFLKHRPDRINAENLFSATLKLKQAHKSLKTWKALRNYPELSLKILNLCLQNVNNPEYRNPEVLIRPLSLLMKPGEFLKLAESFIPGSAAGAAENRHFLVLKQIAKCLNNARPSAALKLALQLNSGEQAQFCVDSLYSSACRLPEIDCKKFTEAILAKQGQIEVRKHALNLVALLLDEATARKHVRSSKLGESARVALLYFLRNSVRDNWEVLAEKLKTRTVKGSFLKKLACRTLVARPFRLEFSEILWGLLELGETKNKQLFVANLCDSCVENISFSLFKRILDFDDANAEAMFNFAAKYVIFHRNEETLGVLPASKQTLTKFCASFARNYMQLAGNDAEFLEKLSERLTRAFGCSTAFQEITTIELLQFKGESAEDLAGSIVDLHCSKVARYGEFVTVLFAEVLKQNLRLFLKTDAELYKFYYFLVARRRVVSNVLLALKLLPSDSQPQDVESYELYARMMDEIEKIGVVSVELFVNLHFKQLKAEEPFSYYERVNKFCLNTSSWTCAGAVRRKTFY